MARKGRKLKMELSAIPTKGDIYEEIYYHRDSSRFGHGCFRAA
jgi:hypothetical protein